MKKIERKILNLIINGKISKEEGFMYLACVSSKNSLDPNTKVGAVIVNDYYNILSYGSNHAVEGYENNINWNNRNIEKDWINSKYPYVVHAERDAIYKANRKGTSLIDSTLYVTLYPCNECAIAIIETGIKNLYFLNDKYHNLNNTSAARNILESSKVLSKKVELDEVKVLKLLK